MSKIIPSSLYSCILLIIITSLISCGFEDRIIDEENRTSTSKSVTHTRSDGTKETIRFKTPLELGGIGSSPLAFSVTDINGDSREDIILLNNTDGSESRAIQILTRTETNTSNNADDLFTIKTVSIDNTPQHLVVQDVNGDDIVDVIVAHRLDDKLSYWTGKLSGARYSLSKSATEIEVGDFPIFMDSGDFKASGTIGIVVANFNSEIVSIISDFTTNKIKVAKKRVVEAKTIQVITGDFNDDGCPDIATLNNEQRMVYLFRRTACARGSTSVNFKKFGEKEVGDSPQALIGGDWDQDGNIDIAVTNTASNSLSVLYGDSKGNFKSVAIDVGRGPGQLASSDLNDDGVMDFIVGNNTDRDLTILVSNGLASRETKSKNIYNRGDIVTGLTPSGSRPSFIKVVDINFDRKDDIILTLPFINRLSILLRK